MMFIRRYFVIMQFIDNYPEDKQNVDAESPYIRESLTRCEVPIQKKLQEHDHV